MAKDDVRRYCLDCSGATGRLVEMTCPSRERTNAQRAKRRGEKAKRERERRAREEAIRFQLPDGTDVRDVMKRIHRLSVWKAEDWGVTLPKLKWATTRVYTYGWPLEWAGCKGSSQFHPRTGTAWFAWAVHRIAGEVVAGLWPGQSYEDRDANVNAIAVAAAAEYTGHGPDDIRQAIVVLRRLRGPNYSYRIALANVLTGLDEARAEAP